jgi:ribosomal protein S18 acetylase RimI-like enzyme
VPDTPIEISRVRTPTPADVAALARLLPQLSSARPPELDELTAITSSQLTALLFASRDGEVVGTLTLAAFRVPTGVRAWIEDVVVDEHARGGGIGEALVLAALEVARELGSRTVDLTSRPSREAANRLYRRVGFVERSTNVYRFALED